MTEIGGTLKIQNKRYFRKSFFRFRQKPAGLVQFQMNNILSRRHRITLFPVPEKAPAGNSMCGKQLFQIGPGGKVVSEAESM